MNPAKDDDSTTPDPELLNTFVKGDRDAAHHAFRQLVTRHERLVWNVCRRQLNNRCDIEDAFQTTFMLLATRANRIRKPDSLATWLYGVAWKTSARLRKRRNVTPLTDDELLTSADDTPFEIIAKRFQVESVDHHLGLLDQKYREPLVLYYFAGLNTRQIARQLDISLSAAEGRLRRGRAKLRVELAGVGVLLSPVLLAANMVPHIQSTPGLVGLTCERCITAIQGTSSFGATLYDAASSLSGSLDTGTKLMICKSAVLIAMASLLAAGGAMHFNATSHRQAVADQIWITADQQEPAEQQLDVSPTDDDDKAQATTGEALHHHLMAMHHRIHLHAHHLLHWIHGEKSQDAQLHDHHEHLDIEHPPHGIHD